MKSIRKLIIILCALFFSLPAYASKINDVYVVLLIMDGFNYKTFTKAIDQGRAPTLKKYFIDNGAYFTNAISQFPSTSPTVYQAFTSGLFPGHSGIVYLEWFDRTLEKPVNYFTPSGHNRQKIDFLNLNALLDPNEKDLYPPSTIFDHLKDYETASIYSNFNGNATIVKPTFPIDAAWSTFISKNEENLDRYAFKILNELFDRQENKIPRFSLVGLYGFDALGHNYGYNSELLMYNTEQFDELLSKFITKLKKKGIFDKTYIILAADHGMHNVPNGLFDLEKYAKSIGLTLYPGTPRSKNYNAYVSTRGLCSSHIYIKGKEDWSKRPSLEEMKNYYGRHRGRPLHLDIVDSLVKAKEIKFVIARDGFNKVHVFSKQGHGLIKLKRNGLQTIYNYSIIDGTDPLEIRKSKASSLIGNRFYSDQVWFSKSYDHKYPDAVVELSQIFADGRSGDIFVIAEDSWVFYRGKNGTHGSIIKDDMHIPFLIHGPGIPKGKFGAVRAIDLFPTVLEWFGIKGNPRHYDGKGLFKSSANYQNSKRLADKQITKLKHIIQELKDQKKDKDKIKLANEDVLDINIWITKEQLKRISLEQKNK